MYLGAWAVGLGAPGHRLRRWLTVGCNPLSLASADTTPLGPLPPGPDGDATAAVRAANAQFAASVEPTRRRIETAIRSVGATEPVPTFFDGLVTVPDVFAALTVPGLGFERRDAPDTLHPVGVLPAPTPSGWTPPAWWDDLDSGRAVVVVTQGTLANHNLGQLIRPTIEALAEENVLVVAALGRGAEALLGPIPSNARVEAFVPFAAILPRTDVFVTNGGFGGTQQALAASTPVVVAGDTDDKTLVAARGVGLDLGTATPSTGQLRSAVLGLLGDEQVHQRVTRLAAGYAHHDALTTIQHLALPLGR